MGKKSLETLTESMFYLLMAFMEGEMCGIEVVDFVNKRTDDRVKLGPGTLYTILGKFVEESLIEETLVEGRKRTYRITQQGIDAYKQEIERLQRCVADAQGGQSNG